MKLWRHFKTITHHRFLVGKYCFRVGLYSQGLCHDLSKYSPTEFFPGVRYFQGNRSPNSAQREKEGCSTAWMHHKGRNRHHYEYWTDIDLNTKTYAPVQLPRRYLVEMVMDRIAACRVYRGADYEDGAALDYFTGSADARNMHPETRRQLTVLLTMLKEKGEKETFAFIRRTVLKGEDF